jgi:hypothetical protein
VSSKQSNFFFRFEPKQTETQSVSVVFRFVSRNQKHFFGLFRCFGPISKQPKQTEFCQNKPKKSPKKTFSIRGSSKPLIFFLDSKRNKPKLNLFRLCFGCFSVCFFAKPQRYFFDLFWCFVPVSKQPKQTELVLWGIKKVDILTNFLLFRLVFRLFRLFRNTETPCFDIKAKTTEINVLFRIVPKLVSVPVSVVSIRN